MSGDRGFRAILQNGCLPAPDVNAGNVFVNGRLYFAWFFYGAWCIWLAKSLDNQGFLAQAGNWHYFCTINWCVFVKNLGGDDEAGVGGPGSQRPGHCYKKSKNSLKKI